ncbi:hypothetical protein CEUSTIGMA_g8415.t1 [Chlamydomonas eustigma]|uniref:Peptidase S49 domain-containing protein n=1 Tax=Chlamydomonas eustigma TaxID=1157962 RepID=A0A250XDX9_9CHLO|nr:hypothetical protein CEUSTIGMA_g8415.t1 [Chlamydomonas eustigma]|eukprot:GAX80980.1 hypothetical protein CEUSTIGMA_g8415.t1 [Chlamydomonas eustigma]
MAGSLVSNGKLNSSDLLSFSYSGVLYKIWSSTKKNGLRGLALVGMGAIGSSASLAYIRYQAQKADQSLPSEFVLELNLEKLRIVEKAETSTLAILRGDAANQMELWRVVQVLDRASKDVRVKGLLTIVGGGDNLGGVAMVQELRQSIQAFKSRASDRAPTVAWAAAFGEAGNNGTVPYYFASAFSQVYVQPSGMVSFNGLESVAFFFRTLLDKLKV